MILSNSRGFTFIHIHKAGGTSVEKAIEPFLGWQDIILGSSVYGEKINDAYRVRFKLDKHSSVADVEMVCGRKYVEDFYLFSLVRHPVGRMCSLYNFVAKVVLSWARHAKVDPASLRTGITPELMVQYPALKWPASRAFVASDHFCEFIRHPVLAQDKAFHTQASRLKSATTGEIMGEVFRLEDNAQWLSLLQQKLGFEFALPHENRSEPLVSAKDLSAEDQAYIATAFAEDFRAFGY
jgi:hypothetical protein